MKHLVTPVVLGLALLAATPRGHAQTADKKWGIGLNGSAFQYKGNLGSNYWQLKDSQYGPGISINRYLSSGLDLGLHANYVELKGSRFTTVMAPTAFNTNVVNVNLGLKLKLNNGWALKEDAVVQPYLLAAPGWTYTSREGTFNGTRTDEDKSYFDLFGAAGINFRLGETVGLFIQTGQHIPLNANLDGDPTRDDNKWDDRFLQHTVGLNISLGKAKDTDGDGVPDRKDKCPNTPAGVAVDANGCPLDGDKDGVADYQDKCPTEAGKPELQGCPDRDNDGVADGEDDCPDQPGTAALRGCPDADGDGVADKNDKCPDTPRGTQVDANGCPLDSDGDGVPDAQDRCPNTPAGAKVNALGCPEIPAEIRKLEQPVRFRTNSTQILPSSYPALDKMVQALQQHPEYGLRIVGHADSRGTEEYNQGLSERRAASAKQYFTGKGIDAARIPTLGMGESAPAAPNSNAANMAKNRRVEFRFEFYIPGQEGGTTPQP
ncbi:OmpA family protein [Hymenobacter jeollabukensis]|uniref:OmpA family protein n=1 Tax=Hymenobacter jeollabukensis TaxID=2025313 RepID=A0A5R8WQT6_9BACT|nr:OmpA family protein [Hymenobacter jeollabukensis]TLM92321.1 OmpA family protein [Hymenobacter jeollabukensis]